MGFGANNRQANLFGLGELDEALIYFGSNWYVDRITGGTCIARRNEYIFNSRALLNLPRQSVFATTATNDQDFHNVSLNLATGNYAE